MDLYKKYINNINKKLPQDFDYKTYLELNPDVIDFVINKDLVVQHYVSFGISQKRRYKKIEVDPDFDEHFYCSEYPDVLFYNKNKKFSLRERLFHHYNFHGKKEGRYKNLKEKYKFLIDFDNQKCKSLFDEFKNLEINHFKNNLECICLFTTNKEISDGRYDRFIDHLIKNTKINNKIHFKVIVNNKLIRPNIKKLKSIFENVQVIYLNLKKNEDIYTNKIIKKIPKYGLKSGPNLMFLKTIELCKRYNTTLMLETDCILNKNWIKKIDYYTKHSNGFLISGAINDCSMFTKSGSPILTHINGGTALYATKNIILQKLIKLLDCFLEIQIKKGNIELAYDYALKLLIDGCFDQQSDNKDIWKFINRNYLSNNLIFNYSIPQDSIIDKKTINKKYNYAILHKKER